MEEQVVPSNQPGAYYVEPNGQRFENPAEFSVATEGQQAVPQQPTMPNFEAMRQLAMKQAIDQIQAQRIAQPPAPQPQPQPRQSYIPPQPIAQSQVPAPAPQIQTVRRNLTKPELVAVFVVACIAVTGVQAVWNFTTNILPRIEIRSN
tara:strand:- start:54 stop:497 length:444 start_codon:yes stop_codon:yes gene_type:complete